MNQTKQDIEDALNHKRVVLDTHVQRLRRLEINAAQHGSDTSPEVLNEIENLNKKVLECKEEITHLERLLTSKNSEQLSAKQPAIRLFLEYWVYQASRVRNRVDYLLLEQDFNEEDCLFHSLAVLLQNSLDAGVPVEVFSERFKRQERIVCPDDFWVMVISASTVPYALNDTKWLVKETIKYLKEQDVKPDARIFKTWKYICERYCIHTSVYFDEHILQRILDASIARVERNYSHLYLFFDYLYNQVSSDSITTLYIADYLEKYAEKIGNEATPAFLERLKRLIGTGKKIAIHGIEDIPPFSPKLITVANSLRCNYEFQAMVYPLTNADFISISGRWPKEGKENLADPYVFVVPSDNQRSPFNLLESDVLSIVELCRQFEHDERYAWDIPTACEWLALAGCEENPFPWGTAPPTPVRANLDFGNQDRKSVV